MDAKFPAVTICPMVGYKEDVLLSHNITNTSVYNKLQNSGGSLKWTSTSDITPQKLFKDVTYNIHDLLIGGRIRLIRQINGTSMIDINIDRATEQRHRKFGRCYTLNFQKDAGEGGVYYAKLNFKSQVKIYFHSPDQFLDLSGRMGHEIQLGQIVKSQITYQIMNLLPVVRNRDNCNPDSFDDCMYNSLRDRMVDEVGCTVPWVKDDREICEKTDKKNIAYWISWSRITNQQKDCLDPCLFFHIHVGGKTILPYSQNNQSRVFFYFQQRVIQSDEHYLYDVLTLLAEIGGYIGLLLGYSAFHVALAVGKLINTTINEFEEKSKKTKL